MPLLTAVGDCLHWDRGLVMMRETFNLPLPSASLSTLLPPCTAGPLLASRTKTHPFMRFPLDVIKTGPKATRLILVACSHGASPGSSERAKEFLCAAFLSVWLMHAGDSTFPVWNCSSQRYAGQAQTGYTNVIHLKFPRATAFTCALIARCTKEKQDKAERAGIQKKT